MKTATPMALIQATADLVQTGTTRLHPHYIWATLKDREQDAGTNTAFEQAPLPRGLGHRPPDLPEEPAVRAAEPVDRLLRVAKLPVDVAQVVERLRHPGIEADRAAIAFGRAAQVACRLEHAA